MLKIPSLEKLAKEAPYIYFAELSINDYIYKSTEYLNPKTFTWHRIGVFDSLILPSRNENKLKKI